LDEEGKVLGEITRSQPTGSTARQLDTVYQQPPTSSSSLPPLAVQTSVQENSIPALHIRFFDTFLEVSARFIDHSARRSVYTSSPLHPSPAYPRIFSCVRNDVCAHPEAGTHGFADRLRCIGDWGPGHQPMALGEHAGSGVTCGVCGKSRAASRTACDAHRMQRVRAPTLPLDSPPSLSLSLWTPHLPPLTASHLHQKRITTPARCASVNIRRVSTLSSQLCTPSSPPHPFLYLAARPSTLPPSDPSSFHVSLVPISRFECSDAHRGSRDPYMSVRTGIPALWMMYTARVLPRSGP
jgi:hypothetical protein